MVLNHCTRSLSSDYGAILPRTGVEARQGKQQNEDGLERAAGALVLLRHPDPPGFPSRSVAARPG